MDRVQGKRTREDTMKHALVTIAATLLAASVNAQEVYPPR